MKSDPFPPEKWWRREDRSREPRWDFTDLIGMFGMTEMEHGVADIMNKARSERCSLADVVFTRADLKSDPDSFEELRQHGWVYSIDPERLDYKLDAAAVRRVHQRYPDL